MAENSILTPVSLTSYFDDATGAVKHANLYFYKAGTLSALTVYTDPLLTIPHPQPVITTGFGRVPPVYVGELLMPDGKPSPGYRVRAFDQWSQLMEDLDNLPGAMPSPENVEPGDAVDPTMLYRTGDIVPCWSNNQPRDGFVIANGETIGDDSSGSSGMASTILAHALFIWLWEQDMDHETLAVYPSRGGSAEGDWIAHKQIATPDFRGRAIFGMDGMSHGETGRMDGGLFGPNGEGETPTTAVMLGAWGGEAAHTLVVTELAVHLHDWIDKNGHIHTVNEGVGHSHGVTDLGHYHEMTTSGSGADTVIGRDTSSPSFVILGSGGTAQFNSMSLTVLPHKADITINNATTGITLAKNYIGINSETAGQPAIYRNPTENMPKVNDGSDGENMGDRPHNTLPPFLAVCVYIKL